MTDALLELQTLPDGLDQDAWSRHAVLTPGEMAEADRLAIAGGVDGYELMQRAGRAVADAILARFSPARVVVLCGPGNNGGDGFVIGQALRDAGWTVQAGLLGQIEALSGDAARAAGDWRGETTPMTCALLADADLAVDAIFGAGLNRPPEGVAAEVLAALDGVPTVSVDMPTGVTGDGGVALPGALGQAVLTVTFFRFKPGHLLLPGRVLCGERVLADIGIPDGVLGEILPMAAENHPGLWSGRLPAATPFSHKYSRGQVFVTGGGELIGAGCLTARAAQRAGAGIVTVAVPVQQGPLYRLALESAVVRSVKDTRGFIELLEDDRIGCAVIGPGLGLLTPGGHEKVFAVLRTGRPAVLDADALSLFQDDPSALFDRIEGPVVLTPHDGEFRRLFPDLADIPDKVVRAGKASARSGAVIVLKGYDTVIAEPTGHAVVNTNAPPELATAGAGDVLCGVVGAFVAGGMPIFAAACAAVYVHGAAAAEYGPGLIASDLPDLLPGIIESVRPISFDQR